MQARADVVCHGDAAFRVQLGADLDPHRAEQVGLDEAGAALVDQVGIEGVAAGERQAAAEEDLVDALVAGEDDLAEIGPRPGRHPQRDLHGPAIVVDHRPAGPELGQRPRLPHRLAEQARLGVEHALRRGGVADREADVGGLRRHEPGVGVLDLDVDAGHRVERPRHDGEDDLRPGRGGETGHGVDRRLRGGVALDREVDAGRIVALGTQRLLELRQVAPGAAPQDQLAGRRPAGQLRGAGTESSRLRSSSGMSPATATS